MQHKASARVRQRKGGCIPGEVDCRNAATHCQLHARVVVEVLGVAITGQTHGARFEAERIVRGGADLKPFQSVEYFMGER